MIPGLGISPEGGLGNPFQYSCLENPHGHRNLVGYSPWGRKELDMTEQLKTTMILQQKLNSVDKFPRAFLKTHSFYEKMSLLTSLPEAALGVGGVGWSQGCKGYPPPSTRQGAASNTTAGSPFQPPLLQAVPHSGVRVGFPAHSWAHITCPAE